MNKFFFLLLFIAFYAIDFTNAQTYEDDFKTRADFIIDLTYDYGWVSVDNEYRPSGFKGSEPSDFGKYVYPWMIAHFEKDGETALDNSECQKISDYFDSQYHLSPTFHFNLAGLPRLIYRYPYEPNFQKSGHLKDYLQRVFERTDSYNAWTIEGTENHVNMSRVSGYLYAQLAIDSGYTADFTEAQAKLDTMKYWIMAHSKTIYHTGAAEWNSTTYGIYNILPWLNLYDYAKDPDVKDAARAILDYYACELALHYTQGISSGPEMRGGYAQASIDTETDYLAWLWFGDSPKNIVKSNFSSSDARQSVHAATSSYRPPAIAVKLAQKKLTKPAVYNNSKAGYLYEDTSLVKQTFYIDKNYTLGAAYTPYGGWGGGDWQIVSWKLVSRVDSSENKDAQFASVGLEWDGWIKAQLFRQPWQQFVQHENVMIQMTKRPTNHATIKSTVQGLFNTWQTDWQTDFDKRFPTDTDKGNPVAFQDGQAKENQTVFTFSNYGDYSHTTEDNILFIEFEKIYIALFSINQTAPTTPTAKGDFDWTKDNGNDGELTGLIMEVGNKEDFTDFADFKTQIKDNATLDKSDIADNDHFVYTSLRGNKIDVTYNKNGTFTEPIYDWGYGPEAEAVLHRSPPFVQPTWPTGDGYGTVATWKVDDQPVDLDNQWAVYEGPHFKLKAGILELNDSTGNWYKVDYTGDIPVFTPIDTINTDTVPTTIAQPININNIINCYPNPCNDELNIKLNLNNDETISISVLNQLGQTVKTIYSQKNMQAGEYRYKINTSNLQKGLYFTKLQLSNGTSVVKKIIIL